MADKKAAQKEAIKKRLGNITGKKTPLHDKQENGTCTCGA